MHFLCKSYAHAAVNKPRCFIYEPPEQKHLSMKLYGENNSLLRNLEVFGLVTSPAVTVDVVVVLLLYVHGKHLRSCRDGQLT